MSPLRHPLRLLRRYLVEGLAVIGPVGVTVFVLAWLFRRLDGLLGESLYAVLGYRIPGLGIVVLVVLVALVGWLTERVGMGSDAQAGSGRPPHLRRSQSHHWKSRR